VLEFLVTTELLSVTDIPSAQLHELYVAERQRGFDLVAEGAITHLWRIPGSPSRSVSIRVAPDIAKLQADLESLPLFNWLKIEVTPLIVHPVMTGTPIPD
jgi:muconolactone D-isomerase